MNARRRLVRSRFHYTTSRSLATDSQPSSVLTLDFSLSEEAGFVASGYLLVVSLLVCDMTTNDDLPTSASCIRGGFAPDVKIFASCFLVYFHLLATTVLFWHLLFPFPPPELH